MSDGTARHEDPFAVLGLDRTASVADVRAARRRLARQLHPDLAFGDQVRMQAVNAAHDACVAELRGRRSPTTPGPSPRPARRPREGRPPAPATTASTPLPPEHTGPGLRVEHDAPSFTVDAPPPVAFEAIALVADRVGQVTDAEPSQRLDVRIGPPMDCWCRLDLVAEAGRTTVSLAVVTDRDRRRRDRPSVDDVRDLWITALNGP